MAVKVIDLLPSQRRQVAAAWRECQLMKVRQATFSTVHGCHFSYKRFAKAAAGHVNLNGELLTTCVAHPLCLLQDVQHDSIVHVLTFYTAHVQQKQRIVELE